MYDPRLGRFLSVDPLASKYAYLTPYQFASNRPIDGVDLDGREFSRVINYDIGSGTFNVQLNVKVRVTTDDELVQKASVFPVKEMGGPVAPGANNNQFEQYTQAAQSQYKQTVESGSTGNIKYTGELTYEESATIALGLGIANKTEGSPTITGISVPGAVGGSVGTQNNTTGEFSLNSPQEFGEDVTHELFHQGGVNHPTEPGTGNPADAALKHTGGKNYVTTPGTTVTNIISNIMLYGLFNVDGKNVKDARGGGNTGANTATPGQVDVINKNVGQGKVNGEAMNDQ